MKDISSFKNFPHYPVMLEQLVELCSPEKGGNYIDCTFGSGGTKCYFIIWKYKSNILDRDKMHFNLLIRQKI